MRFSQHGNEAGEKYYEELHRSHIGDYVVWTLVGVGLPAVLAGV